jgi:Fur family transcriptional regulator, ferric uptake regulator
MVLIIAFTDQRAKLSGVGLSWRDRVDLSFEEAGLRRAEARERVVELLAEEPCALSSVEIEQALRARGRPAGRASIYRALELLVEHGLVERVEVGDGHARFERTREDHHHHLVCERCGRLVAFDDPGLERAINRLSDRLGVRVSGHEVLLRGECSSCD